MSWFGTPGPVLTKGYGFRNSSGSLAMFAAIRRLIAGNELGRGSALTIFQAAKSESHQSAIKPPHDCGNRQYDERD
jgi:hypothetical protein